MFTHRDKLVRCVRGKTLKSRNGEQLKLMHPAVLCPWYVGGMSREETYRKVLQAGHGEFLVRLSSSGSKYVMVVNDRGSTTNIIIKIEGFESFSANGTSRRYSSLEEAVDGMRKRHIKGPKTAKILITHSAV